MLDLAPLHLSGILLAEALSEAMQHWGGRFCHTNANFLQEYSQMILKRVMPNSALLSLVSFRVHTF